MDATRGSLQRSSDTAAAECVSYGPVSGTELEFLGPEVPGPRVAGIFGIRITAKKDNKQVLASGQRNPSHA